jgi:hypothetical protein
MSEKKIITDSKYDAQWISPGVGVLMCNSCGAWVEPMKCNLHDEWHKKMDATQEGTQ